MILLRDFIKNQFKNDKYSFSDSFSIDVSKTESLLSKGAFIKNRKIFFPKKHILQPQDEECCVEEETEFSIDRNEVRALIRGNVSCSIEHCINVNISISCIYTKIYMVDFLNKEVNTPLGFDVFFVDVVNIKSHIDSLVFQSKRNKSYTFKVIIVCNEEISCEFLPGFFILGINQSISYVERDLRKIFYSKLDSDKLINKIETQVTYYLFKGCSYNHIADCLGKKLKTIKNTPGAVKRRTGIKRSSTLYAIKLCTYFCFSDNYKKMPIPI